MAKLDYVVASVHNAMTQTEDEMTARESFARWRTSM